MTLTAGTNSRSLWPPKQPVAQTLPFKTTKVNEPKLPVCLYIYVCIYLSSLIRTDPIHNMISTHHFAFRFQTTQRESLLGKMAITDTRWAPISCLWSYQTTTTQSKAALGQWLSGSVHVTTKGTCSPAMRRPSSTPRDWARGLWLPSFCASWPY